jgi:hypothetical protein
MLLFACFVAVRVIWMSFAFDERELRRGTMSIDEDINTSATIIPSIEILGPITQSRAQQINHQVNSFLCSSAYNIESRLLPNDLIVCRNQEEDHGGQTEHQEGAGEPRRHAREGGEPIQFRIAEFESNSESRTTSYSNLCPDCIRPPFWTISSTRKAKEITFPMAPISCPTKIRVVRNHQKSTNFQNRFWCCTTILARWAVYPVGVH